MSGVPSWGLPVGESCPGAYDEYGEWVESCLICYAREGRYRFKNVIKSRERNAQQWQLPEWVSVMAELIKNYRYMRWHDSGDIPKAELAKKILRICQKTPDTKHWLPTRSFVVPEILEVLEEIKKLDNVAVRYSSSDIDHFTPSFHGSVIISKPLEGVFVCPASQQNGECRACRACWKSSISTIGYRGHGQRWSQRISHVTV